MKAVVIPPTMFGSSKPPDLKALPAVVCSKFFSVPSFEISFFTNYTGKSPITKPNTIIMIAEMIAGRAFVMFEAKFDNASFKSAIFYRIKAIDGFFIKRLLATNNYLELIFD
jgi:hypothetical protein